MRLNYSIHFEHIGSVSPSRILLKALSHYVGTPQYRIYLDGGAVPAWANLNLIFGNEVTGIAAGLYNVEYKDDNGEKTLSQITILSFANSCWDDNNIDYHELGFNGTILVSNTGISIQTSVRYTLSANPAYNLNRARSISIDNGVSYKAVTDPDGVATVQWSNSEIAALGIEFATLQMKVKRGACIKTVSQGIFLDAEEYDAVELDYSKTDSTANGADDGTITLIVDGGSGNFTYLWNDGAITTNRLNLPPGNYTVTVHDVTTGLDTELSGIQILEPQSEAAAEGSLLEFPGAGSITFVVEPRNSPLTVDTTEETVDSEVVTVDSDAEDIPMTPDNTLFADQVFPGYSRSCYFQKVCFADFPIIQFKSDFPTHLLELYDFDNELVKAFEVLLREENIGVVEDYLITVRNHIGNPGKSRVYFNVGKIPTTLGLAIGRTLEVINNIEGFNGSYAITSIENDTTVGYQYLVITKNYDGAGGTTAASARFLSNVEDFNTFESTLDLSEVEEGKYYLRLAASGATTRKVAISEPISLKVAHPNTNLVEYRSSEPCFDIAWNTGYIGRRRVESIFFKRLPGGERNVSRNSDFSLNKISAKKKRLFLFESFMLPPYLHEVLSVAFDCDFWYINGVRYQSEEDYAIPSYIDRFMLADSSIKVEQFGWHDRYNSNDLGTVAEGGFLLTETGFLKL